MCCDKQEIHYYYFKFHYLILQPKFHSMSDAEYHNMVGHYNAVVEKHWPNEQQK